MITTLLSTHNSPVALFSVLLIWSLEWQYGAKEMAPWVEHLLCKPEDPSSNIQHLNNKTRGDRVYLPGFLQWEGSWKQRESLKGHCPASTRQGEKQVPSPFVFWPPHKHFGMDLQDAIAVYKCFWIASRKISTLPTWKMYIYLSCGSQVLCCKMTLDSSVVVSLLKSS